MRNYPDSFPEDERKLIYDLSNLVTTFAQSEQASQKRWKPDYGMRGFFADRISSTIEASRAEIAQLFLQKPIFYKNEPDAEQKINIDDEIMRLLPEDFFEDPTGWIESQPNIKREEELSPSVDSIAQLFDTPYDISKVKEIDLGSVKIISKRISDPKEITRAVRAYNSGIPTPRVLGIVADKGNIYAFFEKINGLNLNAISEKWREMAKANLLEAFEQYTQSLFDYMNEQDDLLERIFDKYSLLFLKDLSDVDRFVGFDIPEEIKKLEVMCHQKGIHHKDLEPRNIVIPWDFENDRSLKPKDEKPQLYIIDWESPVEPEYDSIELDFLWLQFKISWEILNIIYPK